MAEGCRNIFVIHFNALAKNIILNIFERLLLPELQEYSIHSKRGSVPASQILRPSETIEKSPKKKRLMFMVIKHSEKKNKNLSLID
jgi:hypothetical protein